MSAIDILVIILFFAATLLIGLYSQKHVANGNDYSIGSKSFKTFALTCTLATTALGTSTFVGQAGDAYLHGTAALFKVFAWSLGWLLLVAISGKFYDTDAVSIPDLMQKRLGGSVEKVSGILSLTYSISVITAQITGMGLVISMIFGDDLVSFETAAVVATLLTIFYTSSGGFYAVVYTDVIQSILLMVTFGVLLPSVIYHNISESGISFQAVHALTSENSPNMFKGIALVSSISILIKYAFSCCTNAAYIQRIAAARNKSTAYTSQFFGLICYTVFATIVLISAMFARVLYPLLTFPENILINITVHNVPHFLLGFSVCGFIGAIMSTLDTQMLLSGTICVDNLLIPLFKEKVSDRQHILLMRIVTIVIGLIALIGAVKFKSVLKIFEFGASIYGAGMFFPFILTLYWKRTSHAGVMSGMVLGGLSALVLQALGFDGVITGNVISLFSVILVSMMGNSKGASC